MKQVHREALAEALGARIHALRSERKLSLEAFAELTDGHFSELSLIERGLKLPSLVVLVKIAVALGTTVGSIVDGEPEAV